MDRISAIGAPPAGIRAREIKARVINHSHAWMDRHSCPHGRPLRPVGPRGRCFRASAGSDARGGCESLGDPLEAGFTTVQSVGSPIDAAVRDAVNSSAIPGPRILTGLVPINVQAGDPAAIRAQVRKNVQDGADVVSEEGDKGVPVWLRASSLRCYPAI